MCVHFEAFENSSTVGRQLQSNSLNLSCLKTDGYQNCSLRVTFLRIIILRFAFFNYNPEKISLVTHTVCLHTLIC